MHVDTHELAGAPKMHWPEQIMNNLDNTFRLSILFNGQETSPRFRNNVCPSLSAALSCFVPNTVLARGPQNPFT